MIRFFTLSDALTALMFVLEPETYPVFIEWAKKEGMFTDILALDKLRAESHLLANMCSEAHASATA